MVEEVKNFGMAVRQLRIKRGIMQKDVAVQILKKDGTPITSTYLHEIELSRCNPPSDEIIEQLAQVLSVPEDYLYYWADRIPPRLRKRENTSVQAAISAYQSFAQALTAHTI